MNAYIDIAPGGCAAEQPLDGLVKDLKKTVVRMTEAAGGGYIAQGLGSAEMIAHLFYRVLRLDPAEPEWALRDRFLLSVGHYAIGVYAAMARLGYFPDELLNTYSADGSVIEMIGSETTPGFEITGGSLAQGLSQGVGLALAAKLRQHPWRTVVYMSDGELEEGQTWEAAMVAKHHGLDNLLAIVDVNGMQADGRIQEVTGILPIAEKWRAFGWDVAEIDGNDPAAVEQALGEAFRKEDKPMIIVAHTVPGNGVSELHGKHDVHYVRWTKEQSETALRELDFGMGGGTAP
ncbi:transketolase [Paenibacillus sacheonensis]|uniref:Transketolase n=1 Tax=Paenibacillus sacheonensis TaxID=742054 RepID=A0A7X5C368_9BACL|nr:transketolase [Paenibacillus sacheonensis]MBM7568360.1 transketolase [Paenibacillus sacheonensis]NBC72060.1 transketolase [Paenibacillus sacheonensis]